MRTSTVWKEEVNKGLIKYTQDVFKSFTVGGEPYEISSEAHTIQVRKPDEDLKIEKHPCITWYNTMDLPSPWRTDNNVKHPYTTSNGVEQTYVLPIPFDMYYQLDFWAKKWGHIDLMTQMWLASLPDYSMGTFFNLPVVDSNGEEMTVLCLQKDILRRRDTLTEGEKILHSTIVYAVQGHIGRDYPEYDDYIEKIIVEKERF